MPCVYLPGPAPAVTVANSIDPETFDLYYRSCWVIIVSIHQQKILSFVSLALTIDHRIIFTPMTIDPSVRTPKK